MLDRLGQADRIRGISALFALISTYLPWYHFHDAHGSTTVNAFGAGFLGDTLFFGAIATLLMLAMRIGLVDRLYPPASLREETWAYARDLADFVSPSAIAVIKRQLYDAPFQTLAEATIDANREMVVSLRGSDFREGVASFVEKRPPRFTGK